MKLLEDGPTIASSPSIYFDNLASFEATHWWSQSMWKVASGWLAESAKGRTGLVALDVGCGSGLTTARLAECELIETVMGFDPSEEGLEWSRSRHGLPLARASATKIPLSDSSVDVAVCFDVLQHLGPGEDATAMSEIARVLRPSGLAVLRTCAKRIVPPNLPAQGASYTRTELERLIEISGLRVNRISHANMAPALVDEYRAWRANRLGASFKHALSGGETSGKNRIARTLAAWEAFVLARLGIRLPWGHSLIAIAQKRLTSEPR